MDTTAIGTISTLVFIAVNGLWYYIKYVLRQNGYETHLFSGHFRDIANLHNLHDQEKDRNKRRTYKILLLALYIGVVLFFILVWALFSK